MARINRSDYKDSYILESTGFAVHMTPGSPKEEPLRNLLIFVDWARYGDSMAALRDRYHLAESTIEKILKRGRSEYNWCKADPVRTLDPSLVEDICLSDPSENMDDVLNFLAENGMDIADEFLAFSPELLYTMTFDDAMSNMVKKLSKAYRYILKKEYPERDACTYVFIRENITSISIGLSPKKAQMLIGKYSKDYSMSISSNFRLAPIKFVLLRDKEV